MQYKLSLNPFKITAAVINTIRKSYLMRGFDYKYYKTIAKNVNSRRAARNHYITKGATDGLNPNKWFDTKYYLEKYPDVKYSNTNPYIHYMIHGIYEDREPNGNKIPAKKVKSKIRVAWRYYKVHGIKNFLKKLFTLKDKDGDISVAMWELLHGIGFLGAITQRNHRFNITPLFSILVPAYGTKATYFKRLLKSLLKQTYGNWELCIADAGHGDDIATIINSYDDNRIKYNSFKENKGISGNTNEAFAMSSGNYIVLLDHDDFLSKDALYEVAKSINQNPDVDFIYSDRAMVDSDGEKITHFTFLYGYSPDMLRCHNYPCHLSVYSRKVAKAAGLWNPDFDGSQDYDFSLRVIENTDTVVHIKKILYFWRACEGSVAQASNNKPYAFGAAKKAIEEHTTRINWPAKVDFVEELLTYRLRYEIKGNPSVAIIIPNMDYADVLKKCIDSILTRTTYENYRIYIVENNSRNDETFELYKKFETDERISIIYHPPGEFNFPSINNMAVKNIGEEYLILLNNDTSVISPNWIEEMLMFAQRDDVGAVGSMLYYEDNTIQHCGLEIGLGGWIASHHEHAQLRSNGGYLNILTCPRNVNAVTGACLMLSKKDYIAVDGMDEVNFKVSLNDMDLCLKLREHGKLNVFTPYAELYHYEGKSRGNDMEPRHMKRYMKECDFFRNKWSKYFDEPDMYTNPNTAKFIY